MNDTAVKTFVNDILDGVPVRSVLESWLDGPAYDAWKTSPPEYDEPDMEEVTATYNVIDFSVTYDFDAKNYSVEQLLDDLSDLGFTTTDAKVIDKTDDGDERRYCSIEGVYYETEFEGAWYGDDFEFEDPSPEKYSAKIEKDIDAFEKTCKDKYNFDVEFFIDEPEYELPPEPNDFGEPDEDHYRYDD